MKTPKLEQRRDLIRKLLGLLLRLIKSSGLILKTDGGVALTTVDKFDVQVLDQKPNTNDMIADLSDIDIAAHFAASQIKEGNKLK